MCQTCESAGPTYKRNRFYLCRKRRAISVKIMILNVLIFGLKALMSWYDYLKDFFDHIPVDIIFYRNCGSDIFTCVYLRV